jgi:hypothetical protein
MPSLRRTSRETEQRWSKLQLPVLNQRCVLTSCNLFCSFGSSRFGPPQNPHKIFRLRIKGSTPQSLLPTRDTALIRSTIPARLDRLPWSGWHWRVCIALGVAWVLDGLEVTLVGSLGAVLQRSDSLSLSAGEIGASGLALHRRRRARRTLFRKTH